MNILIIDHEDHDILKALTAVLEGQTRNFEMISSSAIDEALSTAQSLERLDVLVIDSVSHQLSAFDVRETLKSRFPGLRSIILLNEPLSDPALLQGDAVVAYPINGNFLLSKLDSLIQVFEENPSYAVESAPPLVVETAEGLQVNLIPAGQPSDSESYEPVTATMPQAVSNQVSPEATADDSQADPRASETQKLKSRSARLRRLTDNTGFSGQLEQFQPAEIIQMLCNSGRTGRLVVSRGLTNGTIYVQEGNISHAISGSLIGDEAVYELSGWRTGRFAFEDDVTDKQQTITSNWQHLLMEAARLQDERGNVQAEDPENLVGKQLGDYLLDRKVGRGYRGDLYEATQQTMDRRVMLEILTGEEREDHEAVQSFIASASAKAQIQHKSILTVYEAGENDGYYYYSQELVQSPSLADLQHHGQTLDDLTALRIIRVAAECLSYLNHNRIPHGELLAEHLFMPRDGNPRISNIAEVDGEATHPVQNEIRSLANIISQVTQGGANLAQEVKNLLAKMQLQGAAGFLSWGALIQEVRALEPRVVPEDAYKLTEQDEAAIRAVEATKRQQKRSFYATMAVIFLLFWIVIGIIYWRFFLPDERTFTRMLAVPAGQFIFQDGETAETGQFWIDEYEITIGQYARFLAAVQREPDLFEELSHPDQPASKRNFKPAEWDAFFDAAQRGRVYRNVYMNLNMPVFNVTWYDAYAFAKHRGNRLPTEEEWAKAARGTDGRAYPWGQELTDPARANSGVDFIQTPGPQSTGVVDGYAWWAPVDAHPQDESPYNVRGMAGNVSEWTATWNTDEVGVRTPVVRGGNFATIDLGITQRQVHRPGESGYLSIGFRTVSDTAPE
ncbi:MAG: SUMF1/EgtB/PvdO family nonheme iron enzyme [Verrucomicrobiales bacterium]